MRSSVGGVILWALLLPGCASSDRSREAELTRRWAATSVRHYVNDSSTTNELNHDFEPDAVSSLPRDLLTLETARMIAVQANPDVHAALARLETASARLDEAQARWSPTVVFTHNSARTFQTPASRNRLSTLASTPPSVPVDLESTNTFAVTALLNALRRPLFGLGNPRGNTNPFSEHSTALTATWVVFDGYIREAQIRAAELARRATEFSLDDVRRVIVNAVDSAYFQVQLAEEQLRIARADEAFSREQHEETEKLRQAGRASQADVGNFRVRMLVAQTNVSVAEGQRDTGRVILAELMGLAGATLPDALILSPLEVEAEVDMAPVDPEALIVRALTDRPDVRQFEALVASQQEEIAVTRGALSPSVVLSGSYGFDHSQTFRYGNEDQSSAAAIEVRWELYTGGARQARILGAESRYAETAAQWKRLRLSVESQVRSATIAVTDAQRQILLQRESLATAQENRRVVQAGYVAGRESLTRLNEAQRDYITAEANLALARIRLRQAWSDLHAATGDSSSVSEKRLDLNDDHEPPGS